VLNLFILQLREINFAKISTIRKFQIGTLLCACIFAGALKYSDSKAAETTTAEPISTNVAPTESSSTQLPSTSPTTPSSSLSTTDIPCSGNPSICPFTEALTCEDGFCKCAYPHLTYNHETKKCTAKVGEQCGFFIGLKNSSRVSCPPNAVCALVNLEMLSDGQNQYSNHQCACIYTHYQSPTGECLPLANHGESCDESKRCNGESELICVNGTCQCQFGYVNQFFDSEKNSCVSYAGGECMRSCVDNAMCDFRGTGTCQCRLDHRPNPERQCEPIPPGYLSMCLGEKELCNTAAGLKCIDKVCQCGNPLHQVYDFQQDKCIGLVGDICDPEQPNNCVANASCTSTSIKTSSSNSNNNGGIHSECTCVSGWSTTPYRKCMKGYGQPCSNEFCNVYRGLACINGKCDCYDSFLKYDEGSEACRSSVGSPCGKIFVPFPGDWLKSSCPECDSYYFACDNESVCTRDFTESNEIGALEKFRCQVKNAL